MNYKRIPIAAEKDSPEAELTLYLIDNSEELYDGLLRPVILICPGGAYRMTSDREAEGVALKYLALGYHAAVLRYTVAPEGHYPLALLQVGASIAMLRERAKEWYIQKDQIIVEGFSAGGHLVGCYGCFWNQGMLAEKLGKEAEMLRPNAQILCYPVITSGEYGHQESFQFLLGEKYAEEKERLSLENCVNQDTPMTFLWNTFEDGTVPAENSLLFAMALRKAGILTEFHMYANGIHGLGTAGKLSMSEDGRGIQKECENWIALSDAFLQGNLR